MVRNGRKRTALTLPFFEYSGDGKQQTFQFHVGMPVISKVNDKERRYCNNDWGVITGFDEKVTVMGRETLEFAFEEFCGVWIPTFALTCHGTWDWRYCVGDWDRMDARIRYTAFSRSRRVDQVLKFE